MKRFSYLTLIVLSIILQGCKNAPTAANNSSGWSEVTANAPWAARYGMSGAVFNSNMWVIGGASGTSSSTYYGDVWKSGDGKSWTQTASPGFGGRYGSQVLAFNNQLFLIGGNNSGTLTNDVWSSYDGTTWTQILATNYSINSSVVGGTQFCPREDFSAVVFNNLMWVIGGTDNASLSEGLNDVWSSPDGVTWTQALANAPLITLSTAKTQFPGRWNSAAVSFNNNIYLMCGHDTGNAIGDIDSDTWSTANGTTWTLAGYGFANVYDHQLVVNKGTVVTTCGNAPWEGGPFNGVNSTTDFKTWTNTPNMPFTGRFGHLSFSFNNEVWVMGGCNNTGSLTYFNDVWHSP